MEKQTPTVTAQMLIRKDVSEVFNAFIEPSITKEFWFTKSSGKLEENKEIIWTWEMYQVSCKVIAREIIPNQRIKFDWFDDDGKFTQVVFDFKALNSNATYVSVVNSGFHQTGDELIATLKDSTGGFTMVLAGLKAYLEHGINLNLIGDKCPKELNQH